MVSLLMSITIWTHSEVLITNITQVWVFSSVSTDLKLQWFYHQFGWDLDGQLTKSIGPDWAPIIRENSTGKEANPVFSAVDKTHDREVENDRKSKSSEVVKQNRLWLKRQKATMNLYNLVKIMVDMIDDGPKFTKICQKDTPFRER